MPRVLHVPPLFGRQPRRADDGDPAKWNEPIETGEFSPQGGMSVPPLSPLPNRGSYAQLVETLGAKGRPR